MRSRLILATVVLAVLGLLAACGGGDSDDFRTAPAEASQDDSGASPADETSTDVDGSDEPADCAQIGEWLGPAELGTPQPDDDTYGVHVETNASNVRHAEILCGWSTEFSDGSELEISLQATVRLDGIPDMSPQELADAEQSDFAGAMVTARTHDDAVRHTVGDGFAYSHEDGDAALLLSGWTSKTALPIEFAAVCSRPGDCRVPAALTVERVLSAIEKIAA